MALTSGTKLGPYEIQSPLGAGGMGEVYRATDTKLGRDVALKVLPADMAHDPERLVRFRREAKALAQLDHPNIVTIHSVEECDGVHFLTMQLVEGQPLDRLIPAGGLPVEQIVEIASALGDALAAAHEKGIVHRDLKPANVMVSNEGRVKVLDFGLAKDVGASDPADATLTSDHRTQVGVVMGTPAYMSPEQTSGRPLDHRTDIFSMGVVLHEMATGRRPFDGDSSAELASAILRDTPPSVTDARPDLPSDLARVIRRCLEKDPRHRMQTARDVSNEFRDLARQTSQKVTPAKTSAARIVAAADSSSTRADEGFWVAVLPFKYGGSNADLAALADGMTDDIITGMSRFSYLRVIARSSTTRYAGRSVDVRSAGKELSARYVMEGTLRQAGSKLRLAVQLVDAASGAHLWAENYERSFSPEAVFELQDDLVPRIVSTAADMNGVLTRDMSEAVRGRAPEQLSPYEAVLRSFGYLQRVTPEELATSLAGLEQAVEKAPNYADAWAMLAYLCVQDYAQGVNLQADALTSGLIAARRAVEASPSNPLAYVSLAQVLFFHKEFQSFQNAAERAVVLNPMDGNSIAFLGELLTYAGDRERGLALAGSAKQLNPNHPGWYWYANFYNAYRQGDYSGARDFALKINLPGQWASHAMLAAACGQLGEREAAAKAIRDLLHLRPNLGQTVRQEFKKWWDPEYVESVIDGLRKAGLEMADDSANPAPPASKASTTDSGAARADEGFWVAVLPLRGASGDADLEALADGLTEDVATGLSRFPYLQVIAHNSAMAYKGRAADIRTVGRELGARYLIEGSIRRRGRALRVSAQLMDAANGTQLWAESYDREISDREGSDRKGNDTGTFQIQDDLTDHIVTSVADGYGVLVRSMAAPTRARKVEELSASELVLRHYAFMQQVDPREHAALRAGLERALEREPNHATAWACLSNLYQLEYFDRFNPLKKPLERAREAAWRAVKIDPACQMGWKELAAVQFFGRDFTAFRETAERAMSLNPRDSSTLAMMAIMIAFSGDWERGMALAQRAIDLNRHHPGWYHNVSFHHHYRKRDYEAALQAAKKINMPEFHWMHLATAASCGMLGRHEEARTAIESLRKYNPTFLDLENVRVDVGMWDPDKDEVEHFLQGLQKAGLKYGSADSAATDSIATHSKQTDSQQTTTEPKLKSDPTAAARSPSIASTTTSGASCVDEGFWVAVLPVKYVGSNAELTALAEGLTEDIVTGLSRFSYLKVIARSSTSRYANQAVDVRAAGKELGARYVMEGSLRQAGTKLRLAVQLVDTTSGAHLWAENYERDFQTGGVFALQDDLVPRIVSTVADQYGILPRSMSEVLRTKKEEDLTPHEAVLRTFSYFMRITPEEHAAVGKILERAVRDAPDHADSWAMLSMIYRGEFAQGFNAGPNPLDRALAAAQRAVDLAATHALGHYALATVYFFRKEMIPFRVEAERALALNPLDASVRAYLGLLIATAGEWDRGCQMVESAMQLNPNCPGYFYFARCCNGYRQGRYAEVLEGAARVNMPGYFHTHALRAAALGQLGRREEARKAVQDLLALRPDFAAAARQEYAKWYDSELIEQIIEGLRKAGLEIPDEGIPATLASGPSSAPDSGAVRAASRADEGFWVAVLPLKYSGANSDLAALAEGLTEDVVTGLSRFSYLRVIARSSTAKYSSESGDVRAIGKELGARYVMEGSLRQAGTRLRLAVRLVDATSGAHLWAETYDRAFVAEQIFELQDDLVPPIVSTVADTHGVLPYSMSQTVRNKNPDELSPYEALLRGFAYFKHVNAADHAGARAALEKAVQQAPGNADCWAMLAMLYREENNHGFNVRPDPVGRALAAARRAVDTAPSNHLAHHALASVLFFRREPQAFHSAAQRAIELNPMDGFTIGYMGFLISFSGDWERGCALMEKARSLNPNHPGWYWFPPFFNAYRKGDYRAALEFALKVNMPGFWRNEFALAATYGKLGELELARNAARELLAVRPDFAVVTREECAKWWEPELVEQLIDGLRKAGLEVAEKR